MTRFVVAAVVAGLVVGLLVGYLWWGRNVQRMQADLASLQGQQAAAEVARERLKATEAELQAERERRAQLELAISQGQK